MKALSPGQRLAALAPKPEQRPRLRGGNGARPRGGGDYATLDVVRWFASRGADGRDLGSGKHTVCCPWSNEHSDNRGAEASDTVVWEGDGASWPTFHCSHAHCHDRDLKAVMELWGDADAFCGREFHVASWGVEGKGRPAEPATASTEAPVPAEPRVEEEEAETQVAQWPSQMNMNAFASLAGEFVDTVMPHTEADEAALLFSFLTMFGNVIGRGATFAVGAALHTTNLNVAIVGRSAKGRKGTALEEVERVFRQVDPLYARGHIATGLSSGEGLIYAVRDQIEKQEPIRDKGKLTGESQRVIVDEGVADKRLLDVEPEFASVLRVLTRDGNTLSAILRQAWDNGNLRTLTRNSPLRATNAHISILAHVTKEELLKCLDATEYSNGFANRFLWVAVRRSKLLPDGGALPFSELEALCERVADAVRFGSEAGQPQRDGEARELWHAVYPQLAAERAGAAGAATSRAEAQVVRLSLIYALLDRSMCIRRSHLESALEAWRYCEDSAAWIFGRSTGNAFADAILDALRAAEDGMTRSKLRDHFQRHKSSATIQDALNSLAGQGRARMERQATGGRDKEVWRAL